jgi:hypothetical protein
VGVQQRRVGGCPTTLWMANTGTRQWQWGAINNNHLKENFSGRVGGCPTMAAVLVGVQQWRAMASNGGSPGPVRACWWVSNNGTINNNHLKENFSGRVGGCPTTAQQRHVGGCPTTANNGGLVGGCPTTAMLVGVQQRLSNGLLVGVQQRLNGCSQRLESGSRRSAGFGGRCRGATPESVRGPAG